MVTDVRDSTKKVSMVSMVVLLLVPQIFLEPWTTTFCLAARLDMSRIGFIVIASLSKCALNFRLLQNVLHRKHAGQRQ